MLSLALFLSSSLAQAQGVATIRGTVLDPTGSVIPSATVRVKNLETGAIRDLVTDESGRYEAPLLPVGKYEVSAKKAGFRPLTKGGILLVVGQEATVDFTLGVAGLQEDVRVQEAPDLISVTTVDISGVVGERQVKELPLNGRSYDQLLTLNPGVVNYTSQRAGGIGTSNSVAGNMFAVSGRRPQENLYLLNGVEYTGTSEINVTPGGVSGQLLGVDGVREFSVVKDAYGAAYGKRPGAQINIVTASGGNQIHGSAYEFLRNSALDAKNFFDQGNIPQFQRNVFGGSLGGPIVRDKTFLFGNYEGFRQHLGMSDVTLVPDDNARNGLLPGPAGTLTNVGLAPSVVPLLALWPRANGPNLGGGVAEAFSHPLQILREDFATARFDQLFWDKDSFSGVYTLDDSAAHTPTANPLSLVVESLRNQVVSLGETHVFSSTLINQATLGFSRGAFFFTGETPVDAPGFVRGRPVGAVVIGGGSALNPATQITLAGTNGGSNLSAVRNLFTAEDHVTLTRGKHVLGFGVWFERLQSNDNLAQTQYGQASFSSLTSFLQGTVATFTAVPSPTPLAWRSLEGAAYVEDTYGVTPQLELRLGFRGEFTNGWNEAYGRASNYVFDSNGVIVTQPVVGSSTFAVNRAKFLPAPRIGLAWAPSSSRKTVVRAGFGMYYALLDALSYRLNQNPPFNTGLTIKNAPLSSIDIVPGGPLPSNAKVIPSGVQPDLYTPAVVSYSLKIEQLLSANTMLSVGYAGSHGYHELLSIDANVPVPTICPAAPCPADYPAGTMYFPPNAPLANPNVANTTSWFSEGVSSYNALVVEVSHRYSYGLQFRGAYTYSKSLDDGDTLNTSVSTNSPAFTMNPLRPRWDYGRSSFDVRHAAVMNATYDLPLRHGDKSLPDSWWGKVIGDWQVSSIVTLQTGLPFTPQMGFNPTNDGDTRNPIRPSWNPSFTGKVILGAPTKYFDPNAFVAPPNGTYGNVGRNTLPGPALAELDLSVAKSIFLSERFKLQLRAEFFNLLNRVNLNTPNPVVFTSATSGPTTTAGVITSTTTSSRQIQFGLKLLW